jgi:DNA-binding MarR family transcriptional regulator
VPHEDVLPALEAEFAAFWRRARASTRDAARGLDPHLDPTVFPLVALLGHVGPLRVSDLGTQLMLDKSTVSRQVDAAERAGLVERAVDTTDGRARIVGLTATGRERLAAVQAQRRADWERQLAGWSRDEVVALTRLLAKLGESGVA